MFKSAHRYSPGWPAGIHKTAYLKAVLNLLVLQFTRKKLYEF